MKDLLFSSSVQKGLDYLKKATPTVNAKEVVEDIVEEAAETITTAITGSKPQAQAEQPEQGAANPASSITEEEADESAEAIIWLIDTISTFIGRWFAKKKLHSKAFEIAGDGAMQKLNAVLHKVKQEGTTLLTPEEAQLRDLHDAIAEFKEALPMADWEKEAFQKPFAKLAKMKNFKMSPWQQVAFATGLTLTTRIAAFRSI